MVVAALGRVEAELVVGRRPGVVAVGRVLVGRVGVGRVLVVAGR